MKSVKLEAGYYQVNSFVKLVIRIFKGTSLIIEKAIYSTTYYIQEMILDSIKLYYFENNINFFVEYQKKKIYKHIFLK